jgi:hypothetical protein
MRCSKPYCCVENPSVWWWKLSWEHGRKRVLICITVPNNNNLLQQGLSASHSLIQINSRDDKGSIDVLVAPGERQLVMIWLLLALSSWWRCVCCSRDGRETHSTVFKPYAKGCTSLIDSQRHGNTQQ